MNYIISKSQYRRVLLKFLNSFVGDLDVDPYDKQFDYRNVKTSDGDEFATLWHDPRQVNKGCKRELALEGEFTAEIENFIPINRKKVFSEVILEYFTSKTGIKCDCVEYSYFTGEYGEFEVYDNNENLITVTDRKYGHYKYKKPKKR